MALLKLLEQAAAAGQPLFTAEISPPRRRDDLRKIVQMAEGLQDLGLSAIAVTNSTGGSFKLSPLAAAESLREVLRTKPVIIHLTSRDEGSVRTVYSSLDHMAKLGIEDLLIIRGDPTPSESRSSDSYKFTTVQLVELVAEWGVKNGWPIDVFVAGHPELPESTRGKHLEFQRAKMSAGACGVISNIVTDGPGFARYVAAYRALGLQCPVVPSVIPLTNARRCRFLESEIHVSVPAGIAAELTGKSKEEGFEIGVRWTSELGREVLEGAPGVNFNVIFLNDIEAIKAILRTTRGYGVIWEKYGVDDEEELEYYRAMRDLPQG